MDKRLIHNPFKIYVLAELAASVPRTDVVGKSEYFRFGMRDSLAIEASFLQVLLLRLCGY